MRFSRRRSALCLRARSDRKRLPSRDRRAREDKPLYLVPDIDFFTPLKAGRKKIDRQVGMEHLRSAPNLGVNGTIYISPAAARKQRNGTFWARSPPAQHQQNHRNHRDGTF
ncbi:hypothetical protein Bbelb_098740 [Branchiostoma belcheri]|nr:hypothetical protein Bbelb_098740 [Branchiostoma belcheri]